MNVLVVSCGLLLVLETGCGPKVELTLRQPFAPPSQRHLDLRRGSAAWTAAADRQTCVLTFPLPGAADGPRAFCIYFTAPDDTGELAVDALEPRAARGFLIQEVGALAGRTAFASGVIECHKPWLSRSRRTYELDVRCADGTRISGKYTAPHRPEPIQAFERRRAADIRELESAPTPEAEPRSTRTATDG